jgi:uncharacterized protein YutE (UPF0331/DUF86 family)
MENDVILKKMEALRHCVHRIEEKRPGEWQHINENYDLQDILSINLERAVQLSVDIGLQVLSLLSVKPPNTMAEVFTVLESEKVISNKAAKNLRSAVGFRNISVHEYDEINWEIVKIICTEHLNDFRNFMKAVLEFVK